MSAELSREPGEVAVQKLGVRVVPEEDRIGELLALGGDPRLHLAHLRDEHRLSLARREPERLEPLGGHVTVGGSQERRQRVLEPGRAGEGMSPS